VSAGGTRPARKEAHVPIVSVTLFAAALFGLAFLAAQCLSLRRHLRRPVPVPRHTPPVSILKPLCGLDDRLAENLASFAALAYPEYEVLLGLRSADDAALGAAREAARRWPGRFRIVFQRGEPGHNPKVNQLVTLAGAARHDVLVVSDSNVRVDPGYLSGIAAALDDERVGLVTHPIAGVGEIGLGSVMDHLHLAGSIAPGVVAAKALARRDIVVGKSMALRRRDLEALGGFEAVKDVLAEDYVMGVMVSRVLGKRVAVGPSPIHNVSERRTVGEFAARYRRWAVLQRQAVGPVAYAALVLLNPVLVASVAAAVARTPASAALLAGTCATKIAIDCAAARALREGGFPLRQLALVPLKDIVVASAWAYGLFRRDVAWRGTRLVVKRGTRIEPAAAGDAYDAAVARADAA
jgi:ceramide glucosyltransferase